MIGQTIRFFRAQAKVTQEQLALEVGIHPTEISRLEKGRRNPKWETMKRLAEGLGVPLWKIVRHAEELDLRQGDSSSGS